VRISLAEYSPDRSAFDPTVTDTVKNVLPTPNGYGPFRSFSALSSALSAQPLGAIAAIDDTGTQHIYAATATKIYEFNTATLGWTDRSGASTFALPSGEYWSTFQFGDHVTFTNTVDGPFDIDMSAGGNFAAKAGSPRFARVGGVLGDQVFLGNSTGDPRGLNFSGLNDDAWWTPRQKSSDFQTFPDGDGISGFVGFEKGGLIFQKNAIREATPALDTPLIWTFQKTEGARGTDAPQSIIRAGRDVFYKSSDGFYKYGQPSDPIGETRVNETFLADADPATLTMVQGCEDPAEHLLYWRYKSTAQTATTYTDKLLIYHYLLNRWSYAEVGLSWIFGASSPGYTLEGLDALGYTLDTIPISLDSPVWTMGAKALAGFDSDFKLGFFQNTFMEGTVQTGDIQLSEGRRTMVNGFSPICEAPSAYGRVANKDRAGVARSWNTEAAVNTSTGLIPARSSGRFHRFEVRIPAAQTWKHILGVEPEGRPEGLR
jgi:hypothetical protein